MTVDTIEDVAAKTWKATYDSMHDRGNTTIVQASKFG
jgi:hypothetical protein